MHYRRLVRDDEQRLDVSQAMMYIAPSHRSTHRYRLEGA
jgi:hypothetical protein